MNISNIKVQHLCIPFANSFQHASASRIEGDSLLVSVSTEQGSTGYGEGCPRIYVTGETSQQAAGFIHRIAQSIVDEVHGFTSLAEWVRDNEEIIDRNPAAWCALELALIDAMAKESGISVESMFGLPIPQNRRYCYSAVIGSGSVSALKKYLAAYQQLQFNDFKIKLCGDLDLDRKRIECFAVTAPTARLRLDANNLWPDARTAARYLEQLPDVFFAIEEPLAARDWSGLQQLLSLTDKQLILDESFTRKDDVEWMLQTGQRCIANIRISKMGGLIRSLQLVEIAEANAQPYIVGAHVGESSLLTRAAMLVGDDGSGHLLAREGAAGEYLLQRDICRYSLSFSMGGVCEYTGTAPGLGCEITTDMISGFPELPAPSSPVLLAGA